MTPAEWKTRYINRLKRLVWFLESKAPMSVCAQEYVLVMQAAEQVIGEKEIKAAEFRWRASMAPGPIEDRIQGEG